MNSSVDGTSYSGDADGAASAPFIESDTGKAALGRQFLAIGAGEDRLQPILAALLEGQADLSRQLDGMSRAGQGEQGTSTINKPVLLKAWEDNGYNQSTQTLLREVKDLSVSLAEFAKKDRSVRKTLETCHEIGKKGMPFVKSILAIDMGDLQVMHSSNLPVLRILANFSRDDMRAMKEIPDALAVKVRGWSKTKLNAVLTAKRTGKVGLSAIEGLNDRDLETLKEADPDALQKVYDFLPKVFQVFHELSSKAIRSFAIKSDDRDHASGSLFFESVNQCKIEFTLLKMVKMLLTAQISGSGNLFDVYSKEASIKRIKEAFLPGRKVEIKQLMGLKARRLALVENEKSRLGLFIKSDLSSDNPVDFIQAMAGFLRVEPRFVDTLHATFRNRVDKSREAVRKFEALELELKKNEKEVQKQQNLLDKALQPETARSLFEWSWFGGGNDDEPVSVEADLKKPVAGPPPLDLEPGSEHDDLPGSLSDEDPAAGFTLVGLGGGQTLDLDEESG